MTTDLDTYKKNNLASNYEDEVIPGGVYSELSYQLSLHEAATTIQDSTDSIKIYWARPEIDISGNNCKKSADGTKFTSQVKFIPNKEQNVSYNIKLTPSRTPVVNADMLNYDGLSAVIIESENPFTGVDVNCKINGQTLNIETGKMTDYDQTKEYKLPVHVRNPYSYSQLLEIEFIPDLNYYLEAPDTVSIPYEGKDEFEEEVKVELKIADKKQELLADKVEFISTDLPNTVTLSKIINSAASSICDGFKLTGYIEDPETLKGPSHITIKYYPDINKKEEFISKEVQIIFDRIIPMITPTPDNLDIEVQLNKEINHFIQVKIERNLPAIEEE